MRRVFFLPIIMGVSFAAVATAAGLAGYRVNFTNSLPAGIYRTVTQPVQRGVTVTVCLDPDSPVVAVAKARRYFEQGPCADGLLPFLKNVAAVPGDVVDLEPDGVRVNGIAIGNTAMIERDWAGRNMPAVPRGRYVIPPGYVLLIANHSPASFDGRYFGPMRSTAILNVVRPVYTWD